jgi:hypothetical protein
MRSVSAAGLIALAILGPLFGHASPSHSLPLARSNKHREFSLLPRQTGRRCPSRTPPSIAAVPGPPTPDAAVTGCFPSLDFTMPNSPPDITNLTQNWWCNPNTEYAFLGFSYSVGGCAYITAPHQSGLVFTLVCISSPGQSRSQLHTEFADIRNRYKGRYIRMYGACDRKGF